MCKKKKKKVIALQGQVLFVCCLPVLLNAKVALILSPRASSGRVGALTHTDIEIYAVGTPRLI